MANLPPLQAFGALVAQRNLPIVDHPGRNRFRLLRGLGVARHFICAIRRERRDLQSYLKVYQQEKVQ
jgi:hypothetical protein